MRLRFVSVPASVSLVMAAGCSLITSYDDYSGGSAGSDATVTDAGTTVTADADAGPVISITQQTLCAAQIPPPPGGNQTGIGATFDVYSGVVNALRFTQNLDGGCPVLGKDLDGIDTCFNDAASSCQNSYSTAKICDFEGGIDNQGQTGLSSLLFGVGGGAGMLSEGYIDSQQTGFVLSISSWEGEANNPLVYVAFEGDVGQADGGTIIDEKSVQGLRANLTINSYVTNGVLVVPFGEMQVPLHFTAFVDGGPNPGYNSVDLIISNAYIIGHPVITGGGISMTDGQIVGRIRSADLATALSSIYACVNSQAKDITCAQLDLPVDPSVDNTDASCEAISFALGFDLIPTTVVGTGTATAPINLCGSDNFPVDNNVCAPLSDAGDDD